MGKINKFYTMLKTICAGVFGVFSTLLSFIFWDDLGVNSLFLRLLSIVVLFIIASITSMVVVAILKKETIWKHNNSQICVKYGDILKESFKKNRLFASSHKKLFVIPVNTYFDTIVEGPEIPNPLVSEKTIHGKWLSAYKREMDIDSETINNQIYAFLDSKNVPYINESNRPKGNTRKYNIGTCVMLPGRNNVKFLLLALSEFNESNTAHATKEEIIFSVHSLLDFINEQSQGEECNIPLMGTGLSRANLTRKESLHTILSVLDLYNEKIVGAINVVIFNKDKSDVSIFDR